VKRRSERVAAIVGGPRVVEMTTLPLHAPGNEEVSVSVKGCGICGSNVPVWEGRPWFDYPLAPGAPGHEAWGEIIEVGDGVVGLRSGDPVALLSTEAFSNALTVTAGDVVRLPGELRGTDFPGEPIGAAFNVARRSRFAEGETVAVIGLGFIGAIVVRVAAHAGARVIAIARQERSLELASSLGAAETVLLQDQGSVVDAVDALTGGVLCRTVVEAVGLQEPLDLAGQLTSVGGRLVVAGYHQDGKRTVDMQLWNWRGIDVINAHERDPQVVIRGVRDAAEATVAGWFDPTALYTHIYPMTRLGEALDVVVDRAPGLVKALVVTG
jgi:threonine dehydrogenase-like Zn-dependent dehydrogenase